MSPQKRTPIITLTTDFGTDDIFVGVMKGVMLGINPRARIVDLTHAVPPQSVEIGALLLRLAAPYFPRGTIHVAVVDPGVGTGRRAVCVQTTAGVFVGPDNGVLVPAAEQAGIKRIIECTDRVYWLRGISTTFHGRDVFATVAAHLSSGVALRQLGSPGGPLTPLSLPQTRCERDEQGTRVVGEVIHVDRFGNLFTNITATDLAPFPPHRLSVSIADGVVGGLVPSYAGVPEGALLALVNSWGLLEIAQRNGSARAHTGAGRGTPVCVSLGGTPESDSPQTAT